MRGNFTIRFTLNSILCDNDNTKEGSEIHQIIDGTNSWIGETFGGNVINGMTAYNHKSILYQEAIEICKNVLNDVLLPYSDLKTNERNERDEELSEALRKFSNKSKNVYTLDFRKYGPVHDQKFNDNFRLGHMTPTGYLLTAKMVMSYIDYIIRNNPDDFSQVGFIGTSYKYIK